MEDNFDVQIEDYEEIVGNLDYSTPTASRSASLIPDRDLSSFQEPTLKCHMAARLSPVNEHVGKWPALRTKTLS